MTDLTEAVMLPPLFQRLRRLAPNVKIESMLAKRRETTKELAAGRRLRHGRALNTDPQVRHVKLLEDRYICATPRPPAGQGQAHPGAIPVAVAHPHFQPPQRARSGGPALARWVCSARSPCARSTT